MKTKKITQEQGFASIVVALILLLVLSLLTVGFAELARHEQSNALSKQLSNQAYYAAETGVNDASKDIETGNITTSNTSTTQCMTAPNAKNAGTQQLPPAALSANSNIDATNGVDYTCLLVDLQPPLLAKTLGKFEAWNTTFSTTSDLEKFTISWGSTDSNRTNFTTGASTEFASESQWTTDHRPPVLRVSFTPLDDLSADGIAANMFSIYLYPSDHGSNTVSYSTDRADKGAIVPGQCNVHPNATYPCSVTIKDIQHLVPNETYLLQIVDYYDTANIVVGKAVDTTNKEVHFVDSQAVIDVTGRAKNVLKRIQVRKPLSGNQMDLPDILQAQSLCKRFDTYPKYFSASPPAAYGATTACNVTD